MPSSQSLDALNRVAVNQECWRQDTPRCQCRWRNGAMTKLSRRTAQRYQIPTDGETGWGFDDRGRTSSTHHGGNRDVVKIGGEFASCASGASRERRRQRTSRREVVSQQLVRWRGQEVRAPLRAWCGNTAQRGSAVKALMTGV